MKDHYCYNDHKFMQSFSSATLPAELFTHEAHLRLAWMHIHYFGLEEALENIPTQLQHYVTKLGAESKYNHAVTIASIHAVNHFMHKSNHQDFKNFIRQFPRLKSKFKDLLAFHYSQDLFTNPESKAHYLEPDLLPFD